VTELYEDGNVRVTPFKNSALSETQLEQALETCELRPLAPSVGMEVTGIDLSKLSNGDSKFILDAFHNNYALLFRDQKLSNQDLISFSRIFGKLEKAPVEQLKKTVSGQPEIYVVSNVRDAQGKAIGSLGAGEASWHSDMSSRDNPPDAILLYAMELPPTGGDTWVASMFAALEDMPDDLRMKIEGRSIKHDGTYNAGGYVRKGVEASDDPLTCEGRLHPAICVHPATGKQVLYLGRRRNAYVDGLSLEDSEALLDDLWAHATQSSYCYAHKWRIGDLLIWDNRSTLHKREEFNPEHRRLMHRTLIQGKSAPHSV
jgi:taurine dioxygenase